MSDFAITLRAIVAALELEVPRGARSFAERIAGIPTRATVDGELAVIHSDRSRVFVESTANRTCVDVSTSKHTILELLDGEQTVSLAVRAELLFVRGAVSDLLQLESALRAFVLATVRAPSVPDILRAYRKGRPS